MFKFDRKLTGSLVALVAAAATSTVAVAQSGTQQQQQQQQQQQRGGVIAESQLKATLTGAEVVGDAGARTGKAEAVLMLRPATNEVCYEVNVKEIPSVTSTQIHKAPKGEEGPVVLTFEIPKDTLSKGCTKVEVDTFNEIMANPTEFYVEIKTVTMPMGAVRGQIVKPPED